MIAHIVENTGSWIMNDWQIVPKKKTVSGVKFRLRGKGMKLQAYIGMILRKGISGYNPNGWCNIYRKGNDLMVQLTDKPGGDSRRMGASAFSLPYSLVKEHWRDGAREIEIPAVVEKGNLILLDLRDLGK